MNKHSLFCCLKLIAVSGLLLLMPASASADDEATYTGDPRLRIISKGNSVRPLGVSIVLNPENMHMEVEYLLKNFAQEKITTAEIFEIPPYECHGAGNWYPDRSYSDLVLKINGERVAYTVKSRAIDQNGKDVTATLAEYGLQPNDLADIDRWTDEMTDEIFRQYAPLQKLGIFHSSDLPDWVAHNQYSYRHPLDAGEESRLKYSYTILPGTFYFEKSEKRGSEVLGLVNLNWDSMRALYKDNETTGRLYYTVSWVQLPIWLDDWMEPVDSLRISIKPAEAPTGKPYMCAVNLNGEVFTAKGQLEIELKNFRPSGETGKAWLVMFAPLFTAKDD